MVRLAYIGINKLNTSIKTQKDKLPSQLHSNVVYKINCQNCDASYGPKWLLKARINEHRNNINRNTIQHSVITEHRTEHNHDFDWNNIKILQEEQGFNKN